MALRHALSGPLLLLLLLSHVAETSAGRANVNGWYPCGLTELPSLAELAGVAFECATVRAPLCHGEICASDREIELFVKRKLADPDVGNGRGSVEEVALEKPTSVWFAAGGPGASSSSSRHSAFCHGIPCTQLT